MQALTIACMLLTSLREPAGSFRWFLVSVFVVNLLSATQDIATDGLAIDMLEPHERGLANGIQVAGYRAGMIVGGGPMLFVFAHLGWTWAFLALAGLVAATTLPILRWTHEPRHAPPHARVERAHTSFFRRPYASRVLVLLAVYKLGEAFAAGMFRPLVVDLGVSIDAFGALGVVGFVAGLVGALAGGALVTRLGRRRSLVVFALLQAATVFGYAWVAGTHSRGGTLYALAALEHLASGMATAALFTCMMDWTEPATAATDYTIQASTVVVATGAAASASGFSAQVLGYANHFVLAGGLALMAPLLVRALYPKEAGALAGPVEVASCA
jgi:MFS family permease